MLHLEGLRKKNNKVGFVPTMGALHQGHISLVNKASEENDIVVCSIFINPTQFNNPEDLKNYPQTPENDQRMLEENNVNILFSPSTNEIYGVDKKSKINLSLGKLEDVMEGEHRPGHFVGVVQIVSKLFEIVKPDNAYFGEKDFQQLAIIRFMTKELNYPVRIIGCPTIRESNGLAMSSRNLRLTEKGREEASAIYKYLNFAAERWKEFSPQNLINEVISKIESSGFLKVEYVEIANEDSLQAVQNWSDFKHIRCFAAVFCESIRLIDNVRIF